MRRVRRSTGTSGRGGPAAPAGRGPPYCLAYALTQGLRGTLRAGRPQLKGLQLLGEAPGRRCVWRRAGELGGRPLAFGAPA